jgi:(1->4)-alpha-D-glucan 1-alpha-D-glucosylmutase
MGLLLDIVPNHMGAHESNALWWDVLKFGRESRWARFFDIDWHSQDRLSGKILLPVLGVPLSKAIANGELHAGATNNEWVVSYHDQRFPARKAQ